MTGTHLDLIPGALGVLQGFTLLLHCGLLLWLCKADCLNDAWWLRLLVTSPALVSHSKSPPKDTVGIHGIYISILAGTLEMSINSLNCNMYFSMEWLNFGALVYQPISIHGEHGIEESGYALI